MPLEPPEPERLGRSPGRPPEAARRNAPPFRQRQPSEAALAARFLAVGRPAPVAREARRGPWPSGAERFQLFFPRFFGAPGVWAGSAGFLRQRLPPPLCRPLARLRPSTWSILRRPAPGSDSVVLGGPGDPRGAPCRAPPEAAPGKERRAIQAGRQGQVRTRRGTYVGTAGTASGLTANVRDPRVRKYGPRRPVSSVVEAQPPESASPSCAPWSPGVDLQGVAVWLLGFGLVVYLALEGGGYDPIHPQPARQSPSWWGGDARRRRSGALPLNRLRPRLLDRHRPARPLRRLGSPLSPGAGRGTHRGQLRRPWPGSSPTSASSPWRSRSAAPKGARPDGHRRSAREIAVVAVDRAALAPPSEPGFADGKPDGRIAEKATAAGSPTRSATGTRVRRPGPRSACRLVLYVACLLPPCRRPPPALPARPPLPADGADRSTSTISRGGTLAAGSRGSSPT